MKIITRNEYGGPDVLQTKEIDIPSPESNEVLIKIKATATNLSDWEFLTGTPAYARIYGLLKPKLKTLGSDIAGIIEKTGSSVQNFKVGDEVFGDIFETFGGFAEYVCVPEDQLIAKPKSISFEQASAIPQSGCIAYQGICELGKTKQGDRVLINGAGGGSGSFAIQLAKSMGAEVTAVDNAKKLEFMRSLGADYVIDYQKEDFTKNGKRYDLILDLVAYHSIFDYQRSLTQDGRYLIVGGGMKQILQTLFIGSLFSIFTKKTMKILPLKTNHNLQELLNLIENKKLRVIIDKTFPLEQTAAALRYHGEGNACGKIVVTIPS